LLIKRLNNNPYLYTFILGDKSLLKESVKRSYQSNGISHLFAISGMHITLLVNIIKKLLLKLKLSENKLFTITTSILLIYLILVGLSPSILRAILFYILFSLNNINYFYIKPQNLFFITMSISLLINPYYVFDIAYLYSYSISFFLIILSKEISSPNYILNLIKVSLVSFLISLPITLYNFSEINILSILYNLFYVPLISLIIFPLSLVVVLIKPIEPIYNWFISILEKTSLYLSHINILKITFKKLSLIIYLIYFLLISIILIKKNKKIVIIFLLILFLHQQIPYIDNSTYLEVLNVDQGDSLILHFNQKNLLIDTGGKKSEYSKGEIFNNILSPSLKTHGIKRINYLVLTHGDYDHMGEAINLVNNFKVEKVIFNCGEYNDLEKELIKVLDKKKIPYYSCIKELNIDKNKLYLLQTKVYDNENDNSNVIYTEIDGYKFMFMGDASVITEKEILDKYSLPDIDVLKVGHHGSKTSSGKEFIDKINPKYSIISVGKNNRYGHPNKEALENLGGSNIYRTDLDGSIMFKINNNKLKIETCSP
ncbi:MAG: DNA internalization-related competence protein ComEC/Rec2, partial [Bacilli bacterium]|nr:DNA internalization-related competence protein ComEC/Rec2 [Bacilli bacterium]